MTPECQYKAVTSSMSGLGDSGGHEMWLFSTSGFVSIVSQGELLLVRSRDQASLSQLTEFCNSRIEKTPLADYPYRTVVSAEQLSKFVSDQILNICYRNFKSEVEDVLGHEFVKPLHKVWDIMHEVEDSKARHR